MNHIVSLGIAAALLAGSALTPTTLEAEDNNVSATAGLTFTKDRGVVSVLPDPRLSDGRLVLKVVAFNRTKMISSFGPQDVKVFTAAGQPVAVMSLEQLVQEVRAGAGGSSDRNANAAYNPSSQSGPITEHDASGRPYVGNYTGGAHGVDSVTTSRSPPTDKAKDDPKVQEQIAALNAAILHEMTIAPATAAGGQVVTEKINFGRKDERALRVVVEYNGEQHEFNFPAPPSR